MVEYPYLTTFPESIYIIIRATDPEGNTKDSDPATLYITNQDPLKNSTLTIPDYICLEVGALSYYNIPTNAYYDDDGHSLTYAVTDSSGNALP